MLRIRETLYNDRWWHVEEHVSESNWQYVIWGAFLMAFMAAVLITVLEAV